ncbi:hypothetical protein Tco_1579560, partial [Tanacetum coccineum]
MLVQPTKDEGDPSKRPSEAQPTPSPPHPSEATIDPQSDPTPRPSPSTTIPDSIPESSGGNHRGKSSSDKALSGNEADMTLQSVYDLCISLCTQVSDQAKEIQHLKAQIKKLKKQAKPGRKSAKAEPSIHKDPLFDEIPKDTLDYMETKDAQDVGRTKDVVDEEKENVEDVLSTEDVLLNMSQAKAVSREKEKGVEFKDVEETERPRPTLTRSLMTLKPLPNIDPKDKGKKKIKEEDKSETESKGILEAEKKFKQLSRDEEMAK